jgi:hypothetical protein
MKMGSSVVLTLLAVALALPAQGFAEEKGAAAPAQAPAVAKPAVIAPADCKVTGKQKGAAATDKRKQIHAKRGIVGGEEKLVVHNRTAAHEHGAHE